MNIADLDFDRLYRRDAGLMLNFTPDRQSMDVFFRGWADDLDTESPITAILSTKLVLFRVVRMKTYRVKI